MMDEPERILEQTGSALERNLLQEGRAYQGPDHLRDQTLAALGLAGSAGLAVGVTAWLAKRAWTTKLFLVLSTAALLVAIPVTYVLVGHDRKAESPPAPPPAPISEPPAPAEPSAGVPVPQPEPAALPAAQPSAPAAPARAQGNSSSALRAELAALDAVRSTLADNDAAGALAFLNAYFRTFPRGRLHLEAEVLRIDTLAKAGRPAEAKRYAEDFLKRHPNSMLTARVRPYADE